MSSHSTHDFDTLNSLSDGELARLAQEGHEQASQVLVSRHERNLTWLVCKALGQEGSRWEDAEEITNSALLVAITLFDSTKGSFYGYACTIAIHKARDLVRRRRTERATLERFAQECLVDAHSENGRSRVMRASAQKALAEAIKSLPDRPRQCLLLYRYGNGGGTGLSYKQIGEKLGIAPGAVGRYLYEAMKGLRKSLKQEDIWEDE